ncbi:Uncharacterized protein FWK35_00032959 [Aphis craccivora]|uniref:DUF4806 domain-containing protein n=1 Tax=Aphis craccivora TaxID=307492 RepID=A0A6G0VUM9_APHCR|nr:Uncharacterized protein FWK35_00032959 [Aphis craccivora]
MLYILYFIMSYSTISKSTKRRSASLDLNSESKSLLVPNLIHNLPHLDGTINNMCNDEYDAISFSSNSDTEDEDKISNTNEYPNEHHSIDNETDSSILNNLAKWAVSYNISQVPLSALLKVLKIYKCHNYLPVDARTILKTKSSVKPLQIQTVTPGSFYYFSIHNSLKSISNSDQEYFVEDKIKIVVGNDGLPLTKSSSSCFWPILGYVRHPVYKPHVFLIGLYWGTDKPLNCNPFLLEFVNETKKLYHTGFQTAFGIKQRTRIDFFNRTDDEFHMTDEVSIITEIPGIDIVNSISIDYMHLVCLGVTKKLILLWLGCIKNAPVSVILQTPNVCTDIVNFVKKILKYFVDKFCEIYGKEFIPLNVHNLLHFVDKNGGLLLEDCIKPEFKIAIQDNIKINVKSFSDAYIGYSFGGKLNIFIVVNICVHKSSKKKVFVAQSFNTIHPFYEKPINSMKIGIAIVNELSNHLITIDIETCNFSKYVILNNSLGKVAFPILHSSNN